MLGQGTCFFCSNTSWLPLSATTPLLRTTMKSHFWTVERRWATMTVVRWPACEATIASILSCTNGRVTLRATIAFRANRHLNNFFAGAIERTGGLVQKVDGRIAQQHASDGDALPLTATELAATSTAMSHERVLELVDERQSICVLGSGGDVIGHNQRIVALAVRRARDGRVDGHATTGFRFVGCGAAILDVVPDASNGYQDDNDAVEL
jgi:hypothetical protein